jgi:hypothetical protein
LTACERLSTCEHEFCSSAWIYWKTEVASLRPHATSLAENEGHQPDEPDEQIVSSMIIGKVVSTVFVVPDSEIVPDLGKRHELRFQLGAEGSRPHRVVNQLRGRVFLFAPDSRVFSRSKASESFSRASWRSVRVRDWNRETASTSLASSCGSPVFGLKSEMSCRASGGTRRWMRMSSPKLNAIPLRAKIRFTSLRKLVLARSNPLLVVAEEQVLVAEVPVENPSAGLVDVERNEVEDVQNDGSAREPPRERVITDLRYMRPEDVEEHDLISAGDVTDSIVAVAHRKIARQ